MKAKNVFLLIVLLLASASIYAQVQPWQLNSCPTAVPPGVPAYVFVVVPVSSSLGTGLGFACVQFDPIGFKIDPSTKPPTLRVIGGSSTPLNFSPPETPGGTIDGVNLIFTISAAPNPSTSLSLYVNGIYQRQGAQYTVAASSAGGGVITFISGSQPQVGAVITTGEYRK
jgi:hypothetical protein